MTQLELIPHFDGVTYEPEQDQERLSTQLGAVKSLMTDGRWRTLTQIRAYVGGSEAGVSARLRDLRKPRFGGYTIERRRAYGDDSGLYQYRLVQ